MDKKRGRIFLILVFVIALALAGRLFYIQILGFDELSAAAAVQQQVTIYRIGQARDDIRQEYDAAHGRQHRICISDA